MTRVAGVDGCKSGWVVASATLGSGARFTRVTCTIVRSFDDVLPLADVIAIDIPIGLAQSAEPGGRLVDRLARKRLGPRATSVFAAPIRGVLKCSTYAEALAVSRASGAHGLGLSKQTFNITPKIREVDARMTPELQRRVYESHPELVFTVIRRERPCAHNKKTPEGRKERLDALTAVLRRSAEGAMSRMARRDALPDDVIDAHALLWSARRRAMGSAERLPTDPPRDARGLAMEMWV